MARDKYADNHANIDPRNLAKCDYPEGLRDSPLDLDPECLKPSPKGNAHPPTWNTNRHG